MGSGSPALVGLFLLLGIITADAEAPEKKPLVEMTLTLNKNQNGKAFQEPLKVEAFDHEDASAAAIRVCYASNNLDHSLAQELRDHLQKKLDEGEHKPPEEIELLRTAGAYLRRAKEHTKDGEHQKGAADILRALSRKGLETEAKENMMRQLRHAFEGMGRQKKYEAQEAAEEAKKVERKAQEAKAMEEAKKRREQDEEDWKKFAGALQIQDSREAVVSVPLTITDPNGKKRELPAKVVTGEDSAHGSFVFCTEAELISVDQVQQVYALLQERLEGADYDSPIAERSAPDWAKASSSHLSEARWQAAGVAAARAYTQSAGKVASPELLETLQIAVATSKFLKSFLQNDCTAALEHLRPMNQQRRVSSPAWLVLSAKCYEQLGRWADAARAAGQVLQRIPPGASWEMGTPHRFAVAIGAKAAMEMGDNDKAVKFYQTALRSDPEQKEIKGQYKMIKNIVNLMKSADKALDQSYNHKALEILDDVTGALRGLELDGGLFRSNIALKICQARSAMQQHEEALQSCDQAVEQRQAKIPGMFVHPSKVAEALKVRGQASMKDNNPDEAVSDLRAALNMMGEGQAKQEVQELLHQAENTKRQWDNEHGGDERHRIQLDLPPNLNELPQSNQCQWLKKQYRKMSLKWHPDKAKGDKKRAERKMRGVADAKEFMVKRLGCKGIR